MPTIRPGSILLAALGSAAAAAQAPAQGVVPGLQPVALTGQAAPDAGPGVVFADFQPLVGFVVLAEPALGDERGSAAFLALLDGPGVVPLSDPGSNALAVYAFDDGGLRLVARLGDPVPDDPGATIQGFPSTFAAVPPQIAEEAAAVHVGGSSGGLFVEDSGGLARLVTDPPFLGVPPGVTIPSLDDGAALFALNPSGRALVRLSNGLGIGIERSYLARCGVGQSPTLLLGDGFPAPMIADPDVVIGKLTSGCTFSPSGIVGFVTNPASEDALVLANLKGLDIDCGNDQVFYRVRDDQLELFLREGDPAPPSEVGPNVKFEAGDGSTFTFLGLGNGFAINAAGDVAFAAVLMGGPAQSRGESVWVERSGQLELVVLADELCTSGGEPGFQVPGEPAGVTFSRMLGVDFNDAGQVAFGAMVGDSTLPPLAACFSLRAGVFWDGAGSLETVSLIGDQVPGEPPGVVWAQFASTPQLTKADHLFFDAQVAGPGVTPANDLGIFLFDVAGNARFVLREGQLVDMAGDGSDLRTVAGFERGPGDSQLGEIPVRIAFTDGSEGLFALRIHQGIPYGCGGNPAQSLRVLAGAPALGASVTLGVDNPLGTQAPGSVPLLAVALNPDPAFPCGTSLPGLGMASAAAPGELLVSVVPPDPVLPALLGPPWQGPGQPSPIGLFVPNDATLLGIELFFQGALIDPSLANGVGIALAGAQKLRIGL